MFDDDDDDEADRRAYGLKARTKWSSSTVQNQRMAYMSKLSDQKRRHVAHETDRFSERFFFVELSSFLVEEKRLFV